jgi:hypothetical protein
VNTTGTGQPHEGGWYEISLQGRLEPRWSAWFDGLTLTTGDGTTTLRGPVVDQAALHGLLQRLRDLGVPLISVTPVNPDPAFNTTSNIAEHDHTSGEQS